MKILGLELSSALGSVAFLDEGAAVFAAEFANDRKHSGIFFAELQRCFRACGRPTRIVVGLGPGSFAGTRIAIAAAVGLSSATGAELVGVASGRALRVDAAEYIVVGDARRHTFHFKRVRARRCLEGPLLCNEEELRERISDAHMPVFATETLMSFPTVAIGFPSAVLLAEIAARDEELTPAPLEPIYLREPHITYPKPIARAGFVRT